MRANQLSLTLAGLMLSTAWLVTYGAQMTAGGAPMAAIGPSDDARVQIHVEVISPGATPTAATPTVVPTTSRSPIRPFSPVPTTPVPRPSALSSTPVSGPPVGTAAPGSTGPNGPGAVEQSAQAVAGGMPTTGTHGLGAALLLGAAAIVLGTALILLFRRRRDSGT